METYFDHEKLDVYQDLAGGKAQLVRIVSMLVGLIRSTSQSRVYEEQGGYGATIADE